MDKINKYVQIIKDILTEDAKFKPSHGEIEPFLVFDDEHHSYQLMLIGWSGTWRMHAAVIHVRLINGKIWIEEDGTGEGIANVLVAAGVPKEDIVLAFHPPIKRPFTEFAVA